jgi:TDG/mug DNA glycosylase family protein
VKRTGRESRSSGRRPRGLPDHIPPRARVLFVGINPGLRSAAVGHHFAGHSNRFWRLMHESGLLPDRLGPQEDARLPLYGYGITNLVRRATPGIDSLRAEEYARGRRALLGRIRRYRPGIVALVGVTIFRALFPDPQRPGGRRTARADARGRTVATRPLRLGRQSVTLAGSAVFVLPNPSGRNATLSYAAMLAAFRGLKKHLDGRR